MTRRRDDNPLTTIYKILLITPWWAGPILAAASYAFLRWALPAIVPPDNFVGAILNHAFTIAAPLVAGLILFAWLLSLIAKAQRAKLFNNQRDLETLRQLGWQDFEKLIGEYYRRQGYTVTEHGGATPDGGIDLELHRAGQRWLVQCKHWKTKSVGVESIRAFYGVITAEAATGGIFVTTGTFTRPAHDFAKNRLELIDGKQLWSKIKDIRNASPGTQNESTPTPPAAHPATTTSAEPPNAQEPGNTLPCPSCGNPMIQRTAKRGPHAGSSFFGCSNYPQCRATRSA